MEAVERFLSELKEALGGGLILLATFGSLSRDVDVLVVLREHGAEEKILPAYLRCLESGVKLDLSIYSLREFMWRAEEGDPFIVNVVYTCRPLYDPLGVIRELRERGVWFNPVLLSRDLELAREMYRRTRLEKFKRKIQMLERIKREGKPVQHRHQGGDCARSLNPWVFQLKRRLMEVRRLPEAETPYDILEAIEKLGALAEAMVRVILHERGVSAEVIDKLSFQFAIVLAKTARLHETLGVSDSDLELVEAIRLLRDPAYHSGLGLGIELNHDVLLYNPALTPIKAQVLDLQVEELRGRTWIRVGKDSISTLRERLTRVAEQLLRKVHPAEAQASSQRSSTS